MSLIEALNQSYDFYNLLDIIINSLGLGTFLAILGGFLAILGYFTTISTKGLFSALQPNVQIFTFLNGLFQYLILFIYIPLFYFNFFNGLHLLSELLYFNMLIIILPVFVAIYVGKGFTYKELMDFKQSINISKVINPQTIIYVLTAISLLWELYVFIYTKINLSLITWILSIYFIMLTTMQLAISYGTIRLLVDSIYVEVQTTDSQSITGFLFSKGSDHYLILTPEKNLLIQNGYIKLMEYKKIP